MKILTSIGAMKALVLRWKAEGKTIGFVPTMGCLHEGHLSLVREARRRADVTVVSIFVNPIQFGPKEDFKKYPRNLKRDAALLEKEGVDVVFHPASKDIYPPGYKTYVEVRGLEERLCGQSRPGHFRGVCTVVLKLINIVSPDTAFFGWKDAQQVIIVKKMAGDLGLDTEIVTCPLVREPDGLAMSSRNTYLSREERTAALVLARSLAEAENLVAMGERDSVSLMEAIRDMIQAEPLARVDYVCITDLEKLEPLPRLEGDVLIALAVFIGDTRLIDNVRIRIN